MRVSSPLRDLYLQTSRASKRIRHHRSDCHCSLNHSQTLRDLPLTLPSFTQNLESLLRNLYSPAFPPWVIWPLELMSRSARPIVLDRDPANLKAKKSSPKKTLYDVGSSEAWNALALNLCSQPTRKTTGVYVPHHNPFHSFSILRPDNKINQCVMIAPQSTLSRFANRFPICPLIRPSLGRLMLNYASIQSDHRVLNCTITMISGSQSSHPTHFPPKFYTPSKTFKRSRLRHNSWPVQITENGRLAWTTVCRILCVCTG